MESQVLSEKIRWEARRVAVAFTVSNARRGMLFSNMADFRGKVLGTTISWGVLKQTEQLVRIRVGEGHPPCIVFRHHDPVPAASWQCVFNPLYGEQMVRGLYRLGFDESVLSHFNHPLSAHEQLELRLSMPREFWPQEWLDAESTAELEALEN